jgi:aminoglycoside phosphotransferase
VGSDHSADGIADLHRVLAALGRRPPATPPPDLGSPRRTHVYVVDDIVVKCDDRLGTQSMVRERSALELLSGRGLPIPTFVAAGDFGDTRNWVVLERLDGEPPGDARRLAHQLSAPLAAQMGSVIAGLHAAARPPLFGTWALGRPRTLGEEARLRIDALLSMAHAAEIVPRVEVDALERLLTSTIVVLSSWHEPVLAHRDVQPRNVLVVDGQLTALLDFESSGGGDPTEDFKVIGLDWTTPAFGAFASAYHDAGGRLGADAPERLAHHVLHWALAVFAYLGRIAPEYLEPTRLAVERVRSGERPVLTPGSRR